MKKSLLCMYALVFFCGTVLTVQAQVRFGDSWYRSSKSPDLTSIALSPDGNTLAVGGEHGMELYNANTGKLLKKVPFPSDNGPLTWAPDGSYIVAVGGPVQFIDTATGKVFKTLPFFSTTPATFLGTGQYLLIGKDIIDTQSWELIESPLSWIDFFEVMPGDTTALTMHYKDNDTIQLVRFPSGEVIRTFTVMFQSVYKRGIALSHTGDKFVVIGDTTGQKMTAYIFSTSTGDMLSQLVGENLYGNRCNVRFSENDSLLMIGEKQIWDIAKSEFIIQIQGGKAISPDWERFYDFGYDKNIIARDRSMKVLWSIIRSHPSYYKIQSINFNLETFTTTGKDSLQITWEHKTGDILKAIKATSPITIDSVKPLLSPLSTYRLEKNQDSSQLSLFRNADNSLLSKISTFKKSSSDVLGFLAWAWSPNEKYLITAAEAFKTSFTEHRLIYLWEIPGGKLVDSIRTPHFINFVKITADGKFAVAITEENGVMKVDLDLVTSIEDSQPENFLKTSIYPNPLQESGTISYSVSTPGLLKISVHDIFGREMMVIKNEFSEPGNYTLPFKSSELSGGTYFLKVTGGRETSTTHFSILR